MDPLKCVGYSTANLLYDANRIAAEHAAEWPDRAEFTAKVLLNGTVTIDSLLAEIGVKAKGTNKKDGFYDKKNNDPNLLGLLDWFIEEKPLEQRGLFIAMLRDNTRAVDHCISIDTKRRIIMESSPEGGVFPLERASFDRCVADGFWCIGIAAARKEGRCVGYCAHCSDSSRKKNQ